jgi:hypothetical protein
MGDFDILIAISGRARAGKDTLADFLLEEFKGYGMTKVAYADELKTRLMVDFELSWGQLYGDFKESQDTRYPKKDGNGFWTPREMMQFMGTECYRAIDDNFWVKQLFRTLSKRGVKNVIISDCRFASEVDAVLNRGGYHIRIYRDEDNGIHGATHASETSLDSYEKIDHKVVNNYSLEELKLTAKKLADLIKEDFQNG